MLSAYSRAVGEINAFEMPQVGEMNYVGTTMAQIVDYIKIIDSCVPPPNPISRRTAKAYKAEIENHLTYLRIDALTDPDISEEVKEKISRFMNLVETFLGLLVVEKRIFLSWRDYFRYPKVAYYHFGNKLLLFLK